MKYFVIGMLHCRGDESPIDKTVEAESAIEALKRYFWDDLDTYNEHELEWVEKTISQRTEVEGGVHYMDDDGEHVVGIHPDRKTAAYLYWLEEKSIFKENSQ